MGTVISLDERRRLREAPIERLERAVGRIEVALLGSAELEAPPWLIEEVRALRSELAAGRHESAAERAERLAERVARRAG